MPTDFLTRPTAFSGLSRASDTQATGGGSSNWGAGRQPERRTTQEINDLAFSQAHPAAPGGTPIAASYTPRNLGTMVTADLNRNPTGVRLDQRPTLSGPPITSGYSEYSPKIAAHHPVAPQQPPPAIAATYAPPTGTTGGLLPQQAGTWDSEGDTGYRAPQQTERANPLSGDNAFPMEGQSVSFNRPPYINRGAGVPRGQDSRLAPAGRFGITQRSPADRMMGTLFGQ